ncbi:hypothetical protein GQ44DRAFT_762167 [Phaeosphaeriaceae sp. PMI808]|nr:hypothetical protein GQ44DRAFT_762167 [Phaeosphaeriaceae sp. PMI808]
MKDTSWNTPYLHGTDQEVNETPQVNNLDAVFTVYLEDQKHEFERGDFLQACWTSGFDTLCTICRNSFDPATEPPVRLLSLGQQTNTTGPLTEKLPPLFVKNYHLRCLKANQVKFIPVSHTWHPSVAEAYALRTINTKAAQTCYEAPIRTLLAANRRFGSDCSLWHDYISIPQWQDDFRGTVILPQIFKIFETSGSAILHLGHPPPVEIVQTPNFGTISEYNNDLKRFFNAHLFSRLWSIVESDRAGEAYIMNNEYGIMESKFSVFVEQILSAMNVEGTVVSHRQMSSSQWIYDLPLFIQERQKDKCLGYVYDMIADLGCRSFRDKFIGAAELLRIPDYSIRLPTDTQDACLWVAETQIKDNDLSPLLLRPSTEPICEKAGWLKGHKLILKNMWSWGVQTHSACGLSRVQEHSVHLNLELVGTITSDFSWHLQADSHLDSASEELLYLIKSASGSTTDFLRRLQSIEPTSIFRSNSSSNIDQFPTLEFDVLSSKILVKILGSLLEQQVAFKSTEDPAESLKIYDNIVSLLALSVSVPTPKLDHFKSFSFHQLHRQICDSSERTLVSTSCSNCLKKSTFRVEIWQKPKSEARLYLIPGLTYQYTATGGTGIIMEENRIIGRARYCASTCNCNRSVLVTII